jgi:hypothetical protein
MSLETSRLRITGVTGGPLRITGATLVNGVYELATAGGADYELQTERQTMLSEILFIPGLSSDDPEAMTYIQNVEFADGQVLEPAVRTAINAFVVGCKADGIWDAIKASCILAGARTLTGALVPLKGPAPTNIGPFVSGDYNRKTGLLGNGSTKALNSNRANNSDPQDNNHNAVWVSSLGADVKCYMGLLAGLAGDDGVNQIIYNTVFQTRCRGGFGSLTTSGAVSTGLWGMSRSMSGSYLRRCAGINSTGSYTSISPVSNNILVFSRGTPAALSLVTDGRIAFYSIGESLDLALLDARVTTLINTFGAVI